MKLNSIELVAIPVSRFISGLKTEVDVFIKLGEENFVLLTKGGDSFELEQLMRYKNHHVDSLFIKKIDYPFFLKQQMAIAGMILKNDKVDVYRKAALLSNVAHSVFDEIDRSGLTKASFDVAKEISSSVIDLVEAHPDLFKLIVGLNDISDDLVRHSIAVSFTSVMIAKELKWSRRDTLEKLSLGGLLHDVGKKELPPELLNKSRIDMTFNELREYETHPYRGMILLSSIPNVPEDVIAVVYEHHENSIGQGFPRKLWDTKIHPLARVVGVADTFCNLIMHTAANPDPKFADQAIYHMQNIMGRPFSKDVFIALQNIVINKDKKVA